LKGSIERNYNNVKSKEFRGISHAWKVQVYLKELVEAYRIHSNSAEKGGQKTK
jgi:phage gp16-like protein